MTPTASLVFVVTSSKQSLDCLVAELEQVPSGHKSVAALLAAITREASTLSSGLAKLAAMRTGQVPEPEASTGQKNYAATLGKAQRFLAIVHGRECSRCGGALRDASDV